MAQSTMKRSQQIDAYAAAVADLFKTGVHDPHIEEILERYSKGLLLPDVVADDIRKSLSAIRLRLDADYGIKTMLVNRVYYARFRHPAPDFEMTEIEARQCISGCSGRHGACGIREHVGGDEDVLYSTYEKNLATNGAAKVGAVVRRLGENVRDGSLTRDHAAEIVDGALAPVVASAAEMGTLSPRRKRTHRRLKS